MMPGQVYNQDNIFFFSIFFFINQMIQNSHHSVNAQAPSWSSYHKVTPSSASSSTLLSLLPCLSPGTESWEEGGAELQAGRDSMGQTATI